MEWKKILKSHNGFYHLENDYFILTPGLGFFDLESKEGLYFGRYKNLEDVNKVVQYLVELMLYTKHAKAIIETL